MVRPSIYTILLASSRPTRLTYSMSAVLHFSRTLLSIRSRIIVPSFKTLTTAELRSSTCLSSPWAFAAISGSGSCNLGTVASSKRCRQELVITHFSEYGQSRSEGLYCLEVEEEEKKVVTVNNRAHSMEFTVSNSPLLCSASSDTSVCSNPCNRNEDPKQSWMPFVSIRFLSERISVWIVQNDHLEPQAIISTYLQKFIVTSIGLSVCLLYLSKF